MKLMANANPANAIVLAAALLLLNGAARGDVILVSDFDGNTLNAGGATATVTWGGIEAANASVLTAVGPGGASFGNENSSLSTGDTIYLDHNLNINPRSDLRGYSFDFTPTSGYDLTSLSVDVGHATGAGGGQIFTSDLFVSIANGGTVFSDDTAMTHNRSFQTRNFDLTGLSLSSGTTYNVTVGMHNLVGNGAFFVTDGLTLEGTQSTAAVTVPEPGSLALLSSVAFGLFARRRRRQSGDSDHDQYHRGSRSCG